MYNATVSRDYKKFVFVCHKTFDNRILPHTQRDQYQHMAICLGDLECILDKIPEIPLVYKAA